MSFEKRPMELSVFGVRPRAICAQQFRALGVPHGWQFAPGGLVGPQASQVPNDGLPATTKEDAVCARIMSSPDPRRVVDFLGFSGLAIHFLANDLFGDLGEVSQQGDIQLLKFWP